jgi:hypothetical protein
MADLVQLDAGQLMVDALPSEFRRPKLEAAWAALGQPIKNADAAVVWLQSAFTVSLGTGVQLDALGQLLGQPRLGGAYPLGETDADYRGKLQAAILRNRSKGTAREIAAMVHALLSDAIAVQVSDVPPAAFNLAVYVSSALSSSQQQALIDFAVAAKAAGVKIVGIAWYQAPVFGFVPSTNPPVQGYGDGVGGLGGAWANYIYP